MRLPSVLLTRQIQIMLPKRQKSSKSEKLVEKGKEVKTQERTGWKYTTMDSIVSVSEFRVSFKVG